MGCLMGNPYHLLSGIKQGDLGAVLLQELEQIPGLKPHGGGVVVGMNAADFACNQVLVWVHGGAFRKKSPQLTLGCSS